ncbi:hypothetical protein ACO0LO_05830 [Undibacterium sp. TJN25]|uniref:hypothetical protein n=1 Tax=Undibacterium sp. TJN25 TaxID=3413056 RepID=UPI003BF059D6
MKKLKFGTVAAVVGLIAVLAGCGGFVYTTVGGTVKGLPSDGTNSLTLTNDQNYRVALTTDGPFSFNVASDGAYVISIFNQPNQVFCSVANGSGRMTSSASVTNVAVTCIPSIPLGGTVSGLNTGASLSLQNNATSTDTTLAALAQSVTTNGVFTFARYVPPGKSYNVSVAVQPVAQDCAVVNGTGVADPSQAGAYANIVSVNCVQAVPVAVNISGLAAGKTLVLMDNGDTTLINMITTTINGVFDFNTSIRDGKPYNVTVNTQPAGQTCTVANGSGIAQLSNPTAAGNILVTCQ